MNSPSAPSLLENQLTLFEVREMWDVLSLDERVEAFELLDRHSAQEFLFTLSRRERAALVRQVSEGESGCGLASQNGVWPDWLSRVSGRRRQCRADVVQVQRGDKRTSFVELL